ncbi:hypothetical protein HK098_002524 [Nowakowskiella sp. JEL0407]|nr:hypothetical protein HK098_002524 [Nowakowskiella sp. JEL0407]
MDNNRAYLKLWDRASHSVFIISNNVASIQKLVGQFGTVKDTPDMRTKLSKLTEDTRQLIRQTGLDLKNLMNLEGSQENRQRKIAQQKLQKDFEDVLKRFQNVSKTAAEKARAFVANVRAMNEKSRTEVEASEDQPLISTSNQLQQLHVLDNEIEYNEALIAEREEDLQDIERSIAEVNEIFRDLGTLVNEQQYMLDNIESNVETVAINMEGATGQLRSAARQQENARRTPIVRISMQNLDMQAISATSVKKPSAKTIGHFPHIPVLIARQTFAPQYVQVVPVNKGEDPNLRISTHISAGCPTPQKSATGIAYKNRCTFPGCKQKELIPITCKSCHQKFCIGHRLDSDHNCTASKSLGSISKAGGTARGSLSVNQRNPTRIDARIPQTTTRAVTVPENKIPKPLTANIPVMPELTEEEQLQLALQLSLEDLMLTNAPQQRRKSIMSH